MREVPCFQQQAVGEGSPPRNEEPRRSKCVGLGRERHVLCNRAGSGFTSRWARAENLDKRSGRGVKARRRIPTNSKETWLILPVIFLSPKD